MKNLGIMDKNYYHYESPPLLPCGNHLQKV